MLAKRPVALDVVLATYALDGVGGSETYALTVARELERLGHQATLAAEQLGPMAEQAEREGLLVAHLPEGLPQRCDAAIVQDAIVTPAVLARYAGARVVHVAHSDLFDHQLPMLVSDAVDAVVVLSDRVASRVRALALDVPIVRLRQPIDQQWFSPAGPLPPRPRRALLLGNYLHGERRIALTRAWEAAGIEWVQVGGGTSRLDVRPAIAAADVVVAKSRAALEAMSCARAVYVYDAFGGDGWVTPDRYARMEADGFAGHATPHPVSPAQLTADLGEYRPEMGWVNHELVRRHHAARQHAASLVELLRDGQPSIRPDRSALDEVSRLSRLMWKHEARAEAAAQEIEQWRARVTGAEAEVKRLTELLRTRRVRSGLAVGRALDRVRGNR
ncbi:MAG TPA: hypothetical protein VG321_06465 [Solirubrobacteraceae bacterium]|jgi:hypothetical protein|nr:hypothetical protein [Solirubrobacteraceae bacterium]